jgi:hypothetical protein
MRATSGQLDWMRKSIPRESRVDMLRGISLLCIYVDHIPSDVLNNITLRNFGFSDAAELFVFLAGFASMMAYGRSFARDGAASGLRKIFMRCARIYLFQVALLVATFAIVWIWGKHFGVETDELGPIVHGGIHKLVPSLTLRSQPSNLNILPLYVILLTFFPVMYFALRFNLALALAFSAFVWVLSNIYPRFNLINIYDNTGWFFDPFAWQFMFVLGAALAIVMAKRGGVLPYSRWIMASCVVFLLFSFLQVFPWNNWGLANLSLFQMGTPDKTHLAPLRLVHALAVVYVVLSWPGFKHLGHSYTLRFIEVIGKHSLEVFSLGTVLGLIGKLAFATYHDDWLLQVIVNVVGIVGMGALAIVLEGVKTRPAIGVKPMRVTHP